MSNFKKLVEDRMAKTGESWSTAARHVRDRAAASATGSNAAAARRFEPNLVLVPDYGAEGCSPGLCCQIIALEEVESGRDVTHLVDQGRYWHSLKEVEAHVRKTTGQTVYVEMAAGELALDEDQSQPA